MGSPHERAFLGLADQMGGELEGVRGKPLRQSARLKPDPSLKDTDEFLESHRRGELFVAAVMQGFIKAWSKRVLDSGPAGQKLFPVRRVAQEGADIADTLATMWIRAVDYMPPVHLRFGDALSAALTADYEVRPDNSRYELRRYMRESFAAFNPPGLEAQGWLGHMGAAAAGPQLRSRTLRVDEERQGRSVSLHLGQPRQVAVARRSLHRSVIGPTEHTHRCRRLRRARDSGPVLPGGATDAGGDETSESESSVSIYARSPTPSRPRQPRVAATKGMMRRGLPKTSAMSKLTRRRCMAARCHLRRIRPREILGAQRRVR